MAKAVYLPSPAKALLQIVELIVALRLLGETDLDSVVMILRSRLRSAIYEFYAQNGAAKLGPLANLAKMAEPVMCDFGWLVATGDPQSELDYLEDILSHRQREEER